MRVLLVSTYELGHQPLHVASPAAALAKAGCEVRTLDIALEPWDEQLASWSEAVAFSVPMHTATRLALAGAEAVKREDPAKPICFYGLYAGTVEADGLVDYRISGEYEPDLVAWATGLFPEGAGGSKRNLARQPHYLPVRASLPSLDRYAKLWRAGGEHVAGYVETSHGCGHRCRHCPVPVVYDGRTRRVPQDVVLDDIAQQVEAGARHITFGDPDFLNRWAHSMKVLEEMHQRFGDLTYDVTTKVEHLLRHRDLLPRMAHTGCLFVVSAYECLNDRILEYLDKGHTAAEAAEATRLLRSVGIEPRPSWLPFTPWTTVDDVADIVDFVMEHHLVGNVDPVQFTIKLLIPKGSLMLDVPQLEPHLGGYDPDALSYTWHAADQTTAELQRELAALVEGEQGADAPAIEVFEKVRRLVMDAAGRPCPALPEGLRSHQAPRLTEPWFCCAEPTDLQMVSIQPGLGRVGAPE